MRWLLELDRDTVSVFPKPGSLSTFPDYVVLHQQVPAPDPEYRALPERTVRLSYPGVPPYFDVSIPGKRICLTTFQFYPTDLIARIAIPA